MYLVAITSSIIVLSLWSFTIFAIEDTQPKQKATQDEIQFVVKALVRLLGETTERLKPTHALNYNYNYYMANYGPEQGETVVNKMIEQKEKLIHLSTKWTEDPTEQSFIEVSEKITSFAALSGVWSSVTISSASNGNLASGATIKYQTLSERSGGNEPTTAKAPTICNEVIPIGYYYIWSERQGKATSEKNNKYRIIAPEENITVVERQE